MRDMVEQHSSFVARTLRKAGVPNSELDDEIQRTFIVAARRLNDIDSGSERSFLFQVAANLASHARRKLARRREILDEEPLARLEAPATPENLIDRKQLRQLLDDIIDGMDERLRTVFTLCEFEERNLSEIAALLGIPRGTVASRLRRARAQIRKDLSAIELATDLGSEGAGSIEKPDLLRRECMSSLAYALLDIGTSVPKSRMTSCKTLAALGLPAL
jgi:RNA polymerase sigma-70 factor (ECF subfamily)